MGNLDLRSALGRGQPLPTKTIDRANRDQKGRYKMSKTQDRFVYRREDGLWANKRIGANKAASLHDTQKDAIDTAKNMLHNQGGGELTVKGLDGRIRSKDTIPPGNDPVPPIDKEH